jgi:ATP-dependent RNA circularization protein (DNA/RNA ligase family)
MMNTVDPASFLFFHTPYTPNSQQMVETLRFSIIAWIERRTGRTLPDKLKASI